VTREQGFWSHVVRDPETDCWEWTAGHAGNGYGMFRIWGRNIGAHRVAYILVTGPVPDGLELDHLCRNRGCVNPAHLEAVTHAENSARSPVTAQAVNRRKTHCKRGHEFTPENTLILSGKYRSCRACAKRRSEEWGRTHSRAGIPKTDAQKAYQAAYYQAHKEERRRYNAEYHQRKNNTAREGATWAELVKAMEA
jgi:hypothetical protein